MKKNSIGAKIGFGYVLMGTMLAMAVAVTIIQVKEISVVSDRIRELRDPTVQAGLRMLNGVNHSLAALRGGMLLGEQSFQEERILAWEQEIEPSFQKIKMFSAQWTNLEDLENLDHVKQDLYLFKKYQQEIEEIVWKKEEVLDSELVKIKQIDHLTQDWKKANHWLRTKAAPIASDIQEHLEKIVLNQQLLMNQDILKNKNSIDFLYVTEWGILLAGIFFSIWLGRKITNSITSPIEKALEVSNTIARGNFDTAVDIKGFREVEVLSQSMEKMQSNLKQMMHRVKENEVRKESILNTVIAAIITITETGAVESYNAEAEKIFGYTAHEVIGKNINMLMPAPYKQEHDQYLKNYLKTGVGKIIGIGRELTGLRKNGQQFPIFLKVSEAVMTGEKRIFIGAIQDLTEIKNVQEANLKAQAELESERNKLLDQDWIKTNFVRIMDQLQGIKSLRKLSQGLINTLTVAVEAGLGIFYIKRKDESGEERISFLSAYAYDGNQDISKTFKPGQGLVGQCALEKKMITVTDVPDNYLKINSGTGEASPRMMVIVPIEFEGELLGVIELASFKEFIPIHYALLDQIRESIGVVIHSIRSHQRTEELLTESEAVGKELQEQSIKLEESNRELEIKSESLEIQKKEIEDKNFRLEEVSREIEMKARDLEDANRYKSEFLSNMSHELRTPLNSLLILSKSLGDNEEKNLTPDQVESAQIIHGSGNDLLELINEILDFSKIESGKIDLTIDPVNIQDIVQNLRQNFNHVAKNKGIDFEVFVESGLPGSISTDGKKVIQILKNFLSNSFKFSEEGDVRVHIARPDQQMKFQRDGLTWDHTIAFSVSDNGIGIPKDKQKIIFEDFQQADGTTRRKYGGTGLGLSISRKFAEVLGGEIGVASAEGEGSVFRLYLPESPPGKKGILPGEEYGKSVEMAPPLEIKAARNIPEAQKTPEVKVSDSANLPDVQDDRENIKPEDKSLLIIEDDPKFSKILLKMARKKGFKCLTAGDGESGLNLAREFKPRSILLDMMLPGIDGWGVMEHLKNDPQTRHIPIHLTSALEENIEAFKKGGIGYLSKPVNKENLEGAFERIETFITRKIKNLLIVQGGPEAKEEIVSLLDGKDMNITCIEDIQKAYRHLESQLCDCVILQADALGVSLFEFLEHIQQENHLGKLPVIIARENREFSKEEEQKLKQYAQHCVIKDVKSMQRLLDETMLFLHKVEADLPEEQQKTIRMLHDTESILKNKKILIVDDDMRNTFSLSHVLKHKGVEVLMADNGQKALDILSENTDVDLVLMDIMMPVMDGYHAMKEIRKQERFEQLPVLALTAKAMQGDREKCIEAGASDYLTKPVDMEKLFSMLRVWLYQ